MLKKLIIFLMLLSFVSFNCHVPSEAFFLKKKKESRKQAVDKTQTKTELKKVIMAQIYASWCPGCKNIQPTLDQLLKEIQDIEFVKLDVSTPSKSNESAKKAKELKILDFYNANKSKTATVAVITPTTKEIVSIFQNNNELEDYKDAIEKAKVKEKAIENPPA